VKANGTTLNASQAQATLVQWVTKIPANAMLGAMGSPDLEIARKLLHEPSAFEITDYDDNPAKKAYLSAQAQAERVDYLNLIASQDFENAMTLGLALTDNSVQAGNYEYQYTVNIRGKLQGTSKYGSVLIKTEQPEPYDFGALTYERGDSSALIKWKKPTSGLFNSYNIYRALHGTGNFHKQNDLPYLLADAEKQEEVQYQDKLPNNTSLFDYYITGVDAFGSESSTSSTLTRVQGKPKPIPFIPYIRQAIELTGKKFELKWEFPDNPKYAISGFEIRRSESRDGLYALLNTVPATTRSFVDMFPKPENFYVVVAKDVNGYDLFSSPIMALLEDSTPPAQVSNVSGTVTTDGSAYIKWAANTEDDLMGYQVLVSNQKDDGYVVITESWLTTNELYHYFNVETLSEEVWVQVGAIDFHHNRSVLSEPYRLRLPDIIPPAPPVLLRVEPINQGLLVVWKKSSSKDIFKHQVQRREVHTEDAVWEIVREFPKVVDFEADTIHIDSVMICRVEYDYRICAVDDDSLKSYSSLGRGIFEGAKCDYPVFKPYVFYSPVRLIPNRSTVVSTDKGIIIICWDFPCSEPIYSFRIYRRIKTEGKWSNSILVKSISPEEAANNSSFKVIDSKTGKEFQIGIAQSYGVGTAPKQVTAQGEGPVSTQPNTSMPRLDNNAKKLRANVCSYLIEDDDFNTLLNLQLEEGDEVEYSIQVEYTNGKVSEMTVPMKP
jgi:hypothetical protein